MSKLLALLIAFLILLLWIQYKEETRVPDGFTPYTSGAYLRKKSEPTEIWHQNYTDERAARDIRFRL
jgi:hypothetical protein